MLRGLASVAAGLQFEYLSFFFPQFFFVIPRVQEEHVATCHTRQLHPAVQRFGFRNQPWERGFKPLDCGMQFPQLFFFLSAHTNQQSRDPKSSAFLVFSSRCSISHFGTSLFTLFFFFVPRKKTFHARRYIQRVPKSVLRLPYCYSACRSPC